MNRNPSNSPSHRSTSNSLPLQTAITGFVNYKTAEGLSQRSVDSYKRILQQWAAYAGNKKVAQFTDQDINAYLVYMRTEYVPRRFGQYTHPFSQVIAKYLDHYVLLLHLGEHRVSDGKPDEECPHSLLPEGGRRALHPGGD